MIDSRTRRNFLAYVAHHGARYLFPLLVTPFLARMLEPAAYADLVIWNASVWTCSIFIEFGFFLYGVTEVARANSKAELDRTVSTIVIAKLLLIPFGVAFYLAIAIGMGLAVRQPGATAIGTVAVVGYGMTFSWYFQGGQRGVLAAVTEALPQALQCILVLLFIRKPEQMVLAALFQMSAAVLPVCVAFAVLLRERDLALVGFHNGIRAIATASPYFAQRLCFTAYSAATPLIVTALSGVHQAAFYGVGEKVNAFLSGLSIPLTQLMLPIVSRRLSSSPRDWSLSVKLVGIMGAGTMLAAGVTFAMAGVGLNFLFGPEYQPAIAIARWFCVAASIMAVQSALATFIIIPSGRARILFATAGSALATSLLAQLVLVPFHGASGAAMARLAAEIISTTILGIVAWRLVFSHAAASDPAKLS